MTRFLSVTIACLIVAGLVFALSPFGIVPLSAQTNEQNQQQDDTIDLPIDNPLDQNQQPSQTFNFFSLNSTTLIILGLIVLVIVLLVVVASSKRE